MHTLGYEIKSLTLLKQIYSCKTRRQRGVIAVGSGYVVLYDYCNIGIVSRALLLAVSDSGLRLWFRVS